MCNKNIWFCWFLFPFISSPELKAHSIPWITPEIRRNIRRKIKLMQRQKRQAAANLDQNLKLYEEQLRLMKENSTICMWITWLVMLRQTPETSIGTSIVRKKTPKVFHPWKGRMERVLLSRISKRQRNSMVSLRMCSIKMNTPRSHFWVGLHLSWMILLFLRTE